MPGLAQSHKAAFLPAEERECPMTNRPAFALALLLCPLPPAVMAQDVDDLLPFTARGNEPFWSLTLTSPRLRHDPDLWALTRTAALPPDLDPAQVQFPLAGQALASLRRKPDIEPGPETLRISF